MILVVNNKGDCPVSYDNYCEYVSLKTSFFSSIVKNEKIKECSITIDDETYNFNNLFKLIVNVKCVGNFFFFYTDDSVIETTTKRVKELSSITSSDKEKANDKVSKLIELTTNKYLLFAVFYKCENGYETNELIANLFIKKQKHLFIIKQKYIDEDIINIKTTKQLLKIYIYRWLIILVAGVSTLLSMLLGITFVFYDKKTLSIILLVTAFLSLFGLLFGNYDLFRRKNDKPQKNELLICIFCNIISFIVSTAIFLLIYNVIEKKEILAPISLIVIISVFSLAVIVTSFLLVLSLFGYRSKEKK